MQDLLIATRNAHKTREFRDLLRSRFRVCDLSEHPGLEPAEEDGCTFLENARLKALSVSRQAPGTLVLADDSGLEVDALNGAPGVRSARYSGPEASDSSNRARLLEELSRTGARGKARSARFRCVLVLALDGRELFHADGAVEGVILPRERGSGGFGYDALFVPAGACRTFAELSSEEKHALSHRGRAALALLALWEQRDPARLAP